MNLAIFRGVVSAARRPSRRRFGNTGRACRMLSRNLATLLGFHGTIFEVMSTEFVAVASAIKVLSVALSEQFAITAKPDATNRSSKDVDAIGVSDRGTHFVVEHTSIDSFEDQRSLAHRSLALFREILDHLPAKLPDDRYFGLSIPAKLAKQLSTKEQRKLRGFLPGWICATAPLLPDDQRLTFEVNYHGQRMGLHRRYSHPALNGQVLPFLTAPEGYEDERTKVIRAALLEKIPKFSAYPRRRFLRVLVFEDVDMALSNSWVVRTAFNRARLQKPFQMPHYVIYVFTLDGRTMEAEFLRTPLFGVGRRVRRQWYMFEEDGQPILQDRPRY